MSLTSTDERDLLVTLYGSIDDVSLWPEFVDKLLARTHAQRISVLMRRADHPDVPLQQIFSGWGAPRTEPLDIEALSGAGLLPYGSLRPRRVYSLEEMIVRGIENIDKQQKKILKQEGFSYARFIRIPGTDHDVWVILVHDDRDFVAADSALLSAIAPHMSVALNTVSRLDTLRVRAVMAEGALALLGIGQMALGASGDVILADPLATATLDIGADGRINLGARANDALSAACAALDGAPTDERRIIAASDDQIGDVLLRPGPKLDPVLLKSVVATGIVRVARPATPVRSAQAIAKLLRLSNREAALAEAMCRGLTIVEAGASLRLTPETARNYSKRIYAKTGARGQADLVRMILNGLAPLG